MSLTPVSVLTGFLGSGKTTLLNGLLADPHMAETAVLVNEFGDVGIDHLLVEALDDNVVLLNAGCICCSIRDDLVTSLGELYDKRAAGTVPEFRRVLIEPTGLADPAPILHTLLGHEAVRSRYCVDGIVTTIDAALGGGQLDDHEECLRQAAVADRLVLTKTDMAEPGQAEALHASLNAVNPGAPVIDVVHGRIAASRLLDAGVFDLASKNTDVEAWLNEAAYDHDHAPDRNRHGDDIKAFCLHAKTPLELHRFVAWIERLFEAHGERILRLKGVLDVVGSDAPLAVHGVQHIFHPITRLRPWPDGERCSRVVVITQNLPRRVVEESFLSAVLESC
ncbi:MAG: GTP-binding protein [Pseudomonadota bacterium]|nr:GTP-binding protein [Pseudomonadota bacterium]